VPAVETDVFIVNIGDMTMHLSNGKFKSTVHRVINKTGRERYSIPLFYEPDVRGIVEPICAEGEVPKYQPVTYGDVIYQKYVETYSWFTESQ
jgi:isopenicillin N synthase-like dioxygenase